MNWEALGAVSELIAATGVILSILYLAAQVRLATNFARAASYQAMTQLVSLGNIHIFGNGEAADLLARAAVGNEPLPPADQLRWQAYCSSMFRHFHNVHFRYSVGTLDKVRYRSLMGPLFVNLRSERFRLTWKRFRSGFEGPFREFVDRVVARYDAEGAKITDFPGASPELPESVHLGR